MGNANVDRHKLSEHYLDLMDEIEYRRIETMEDMEEIGRLRARAYRAQNVMDREGPIIDEIDFHSHAHVIGIYHRERLVSTIRFHHVVAEHRYGTAYDIFPDILDPLLDQGLTFIDPVRHASEPDLLSELPMPFLTLRLAALAGKYFGVNYCLASIRRAHFAFYRRAFGATQLAEARKFPGINDPNALFAITLYDFVTSRYPFFESLSYERELLFAPAPKLRSVPLTIRPTARLALQGRGRSTAAA
jgi:hypothetical protein